MKLSDIASGTFLATTDKGEITFGNLTDAATQTHVAVLVPQNVPAGTELVRITLADASARPLAMRLPSQLSLEAGKKCVLNVTARRSGLELDNTKITPWTSSEQYDGEVSRFKKLDLSTLTADTRIIENVTAIGTTSYKLTLAEGVTFRMVDVTIKKQIKCEGNATIRLIGTNVISCTTKYRSGIEAGPTDATLTIDGSGRIEVSGGAYASAIGSGNGSSCGAITINGGTIIATGVDKGAGIGSGYYYSSCGDITITGGIVTATGGMYGPGMGSGYFESSCGAITINAVSDVRVKSGSSTVCIGNGKSSNSVGDIKVTNCPHVILDNSLGLGYFSPNPKDISGSNFFDEDGSNVTDKITVQ